MRTDIAAILFVVAAASSLGAPAYAQDGDGQVEGAVVEEIVVVTQDQVTAACTAIDATEKSCLELIEKYVAYLVATGSDPSEIDDAMNDLAVTLAEADVPKEIRGVIVAAVREISEKYVADPELKVALSDIAETIEEGDSDTGSTGSSPA
jgi:hypothetical protein